MDTPVDRRQESQVAFGALLIVAGVILLGQRLGWGPQWDFRESWPLILIGLGGIRLALDRGVRRAGYFWILAGVVFLLDQRGVLALRDSWPVFIIWIGISLVLRRHGCGSAGAPRAN